MFNVTRRVSFSVVVALLLGWGAMSFMILQSSNYTIMAEEENGQRVVIPPGVKMLLQTDKKIYRAGEAVLLSLRNDSRKQVTLATKALGCPDTWWALERLGRDEDDWQTVSLRTPGCDGPTSGLEVFLKGTLRTGEWDGLLQTTAIGEVFLPATTGTYRIAVPYLVGKNVEEKDWAQSQQLLPSPSFTIQ